MAGAWPHARSLFRLGPAHPRRGALAGATRMGENRRGRRHGDHRTGRQHRCGSEPGNRGSRSLRHGSSPAAGTAACGSCSPHNGRDRDLLWEFLRQNPATNITNRSREMRRECARRALRHRTRRQSRIAALVPVTELDERGADVLSAAAKAKAALEPVN